MNPGATPALVPAQARSAAPVPAPERFITARLMVRLWQPDDAEAMAAATGAEAHHLRQWLEWAKQEPQSVAAKRQFIEESGLAYLRRESAVYGLFSPDEKLWGSIGFHHRIGRGASEIGYWMRRSHLNQGLVTEAAGALTWIGFHLMNLRRVEIHCDPANLASARVPAKLGYGLHTILRNQVKDMKLPVRDTMVWAIGRDSWPADTAERFRPVTVENQPTSAIVGTGCV